jgi:single-strand DNA-binding protein
MNRVILIGRATKDFELKYTPNGVGVASGTIAIDRPVAQGKEKETDFINLVAWKQTAEACANYIKKGHRFGLEGRLQIRNYDKDGTKVWVSEVVIERVEFLEPKSDNVNQQSQKTDHSGNSKPIDISDDDLPF